MASKDGTHLFRNPALFSILTQDARTAGMVGDPTLLKAIVSLQSRPELYDQYLRQDARLANVLEVLLDRSEKAAAPLPPALRALPPLQQPEALWNALRNGTEDEARAAVAALGRNAPFFREVGSRGLTPLMEAAARRRRNERLVAALLQQGAPVHAVAMQDRTALHWAAASGNVSAARSLLESGADALARDENDATPLELALTGAHEEVAALLLDAMESASRASQPPKARIAQSNDSSPSPLRSSIPSAPPSPNLAAARTPSASAASSPAPPRASAPTSSSASSSSPSVPPATSSSPSAAVATTSPTAPATATQRAAQKADEDLVSQLLALEKRVAELEAAVAERDKKLSQVEEESLCSVCMERPVDTVILECAHTVLCSKCGTQPLKACPVCSKPIARIIRTYRA